MSVLHVVYPIAFLNSGKTMVWVLNVDLISCRTSKITCLSAVAGATRTCTYVSLNGRHFKAKFSKFLVKTDQRAYSMLDLWLYQNLLFI